MGERVTGQAWTAEELRRQLREACGVRPGDVLIVHSSLKSLGRVEGGAAPGAAVVAALQQAVTEAGTLLLPVFSSPTADGVFDLRNTPSRTGAITEAFRTTAGVQRSRHPTHSVAAWGARAAEFLSGHAQTSGLGVDSPFHRAAEAGASVLMIGCTLTACSLIHVAEAIGRVPYLGRVWYSGYDRTLTLVDEHGARHVVPPRDPPTDSAGFVVVQAELERRGLVQHCRLGTATCLKFRGGLALEVAVELLRRDPAALLCSNPKCAVCPAARTMTQSIGSTRAPNR